MTQLNYMANKNDVPPISADRMASFTFVLLSIPESLLLPYQYCRLYGRRQTTHVWLLLSKMFSSLNYFHFLHCRISLRFKQINSNFKTKKTVNAYFYMYSMLAFLFSSCSYASESKNYCFVTTL